MTVVSPIALDPVEAPDPIPLLRQTTDAAPYPLHALGPLRAAAAAVQDKTQAPAAIGAQSALAIASLAVQGFADVETLAGRSPCSLYLLTIAQSGERKSSCDRLLLQAVLDYQRALNDEVAAARADHENERALWDERRKEAVRRAKKEPDAARAALAEIGPEPAAPLLPHLIVTEPTLEALTKHMGQARPSLGILSDEGGAFLGGHAMSNDNRLRTLAGLSGLWDGTPVNRARAGDGVETYYGRRLACHLLVQPVAAAGLLADPLANGQGFLPRFLITQPASNIGMRLRRGYDQASDKAIEAFYARMDGLLRSPLPMREGTRNELAPRRLPLASDARQLLEAFADEVEREQGPNGSLEAIRHFASKAAEQAARLAAVMALFADLDVAAISAETMRDAVTLEEYYLNEAKRLAEAAVISQSTQEAERLRHWLLETWPEGQISAADVVQQGPNALRETAKVRRLLTVLEEHGWLVKTPDGATILGKRRREAWRVVRGREAGLPSWKAGNGS